MSFFLVCLSRRDTIQERGDYPGGYGPVEQIMEQLGKSKTQMLSRLIGLSLGLFLAIDLIAGLASPDPLAVNAALSICKERGWHDGDLAMRHSEVRGLLGKTAAIELQTKDHRKAIHLTLRKPINLLGWQVVEYREDVNEP
jgi:hypothetical protein